MRCVACDKLTRDQAWFCPTCFSDGRSPYVLGLAGRARHGKDLAAQAMAAVLFTERHLTCRVTSISIDVLAEARQRGLVTVERREDCSAVDLRRLVALGHARRAEDEDYWLVRTARRLVGTCDVALVTGVRFQNEVCWVRAGGGLVVRVKRYNRDGSLFTSPDRDPNDPMETTVDRLDVDAVLVAGENEQEELCAQARELARCVTFTRPS